MEEHTTKKTRYSISFTSRAGLIFSIMLIAIRAFQPNAAPIETWSISSWILMLLPIFYPLLFWIMVGLVSLFLVIIGQMFSDH